jgi:hypothetical protein
MGVCVLVPLRLRCGMWPYRSGSYEARGGGGGSRSSRCRCRACEWRRRRKRSRRRVRNGPRRGGGRDGHVDQLVRQGVRVGEVHELHIAVVLVLVRGHV